LRWKYHIPCFMRCEKEFSDTNKKKLLPPSGNACKYQFPRW
jgi:hypothetical protein